MAWIGNIVLLHPTDPQPDLNGSGHNPATQMSNHSQKMCVLCLVT